MPCDLVCWSIDIYSTGLTITPIKTYAVVESKVIFKIVIIRAISEKRNRLRLAWFDMIIFEQSYFFRCGFRN